MVLPFSMIIYIGLVNFTVCEKRREDFSPSGSRPNSEKYLKLTVLSQKRRESFSFRSRRPKYRVNFSLSYFHEKTFFRSIRQGAFIRKNEVA